MKTKIIFLLLLLFLPACSILDAVRFSKILQNKIPEAPEPAVELETVIEKVDNANSSLKETTVVVKTQVESLKIKNKQEELKPSIRRVSESADQLESIAGELDEVNIELEIQQANLERSNKYSERLVQIIATSEFEKQKILSENKKLRKENEDLKDTDTEFKKKLKYSIYVVCAIFGMLGIGLMIKANIEAGLTLLSIACITPPIVHIYFKFYYIILICVGVGLAVVLVVLAYKLFNREVGMIDLRKGMGLLAHTDYNDTKGHLKNTFTETTNNLIEKIDKKHGIIIK